MARPTIIDVQGQLPHNGDYPTRPLSAVTMFEIHYDGVDTADGTSPLALLQREAQEHIDRDWGGGAHGAGLMYAYTIDDAIYQTAPEGALTWSACNANPVGLAIKVRAGPNTPPDAAKLALLKTLLDWLCTERPDMPADHSGVYGHGELTQYGNSTACPGDVLRAYAQTYRASPVPAPLPASHQMAPVEALLHELGAESYLIQPQNEHTVRIQVLAQQALRAGGWPV